MEKVVGSKEKVPLKLVEKLAPVAGLFKGQEAGE